MRGTPRGWRRGRVRVPWGQGSGWRERRVPDCASSRQSEPLGVEPGRCVSTGRAGKAKRLGGACGSVARAPCSSAAGRRSWVGLLARYRCKKETCQLPSCGLFVPGFPERPLLHSTEWETETESLEVGGWGRGREGAGTRFPHFLSHTSCVRLVFVPVGFLAVLPFDGAEDQAQVLQPGRHSSTEEHPEPPKCVFMKTPRQSSAWIHTPVPRNKHFN